MIKAYLFDLGNVLIDFSHERMFSQLAKLVGHSTQDLQVKLQVDKTMQRFEEGAFSIEEFVQLLESFAGRQLARADVIRATGDIFLPKLDSLELIKSLHDHGQHLVIVSNTNAAHMEWAESRYECFQYFAAKIYSYEIKAMKPHQAFYAAALTAAGCRPEEALFIDDLAANIEGAKAFGFQTHLFTSAKGLVQELANLELSQQIK